MKENNWRRTNGSGRASRVVLRPNCSWIEQRQSACEIAHETKSNPDREPFSGNSHGHGNFGFLQLPSATRQSHRRESENSQSKRLTALRPYLAAGLPLSCAIACERTSAALINSEATGSTRRGIALNSASTQIINS